MHVNIHANRSAHMRPSDSEFYPSFSYSVLRKPRYAGWTSPGRRVAVGAADELGLLLVYATGDAAREGVDVVALFRV